MVLPSYNSLLIKNSFIGRKRTHCNGVQFWKIVLRARKCIQATDRGLIKGKIEPREGGSAPDFKKGEAEGQFGVAP